MTTRTSKTPATKPRLLFFQSGSSGRCRRVEGFLAQVLQRRSNHDTFELVRVDADAHAELVERFKIETSSPASVPRPGCRTRRAAATSNDSSHRGSDEPTLTSTAADSSPSPP